MSDGPLFPDVYPRGGQVAILCEGDAVGYEAKLLKQWADAARPGGHSSTYGRVERAMRCLGVADAIGRTTRFVVLEDRDFRSPEEVNRSHDVRRKTGLRETWQFLIGAVGVGTRSRTTFSTTTCSSP